MIYVLYHDNCYDGFGAALAAYMKFRDGAEYIPVKYGQPPPDMEPNSSIYLVDFSYPRDVILDLYEKHEHVTIIDHHHTAAQDLNSLVGTLPKLDITFNMDHSGAILTWRAMFPNHDDPLLLLYVEDRDLWHWSLPESRAVSAGLASFPFDFEMWEMILVDGAPGIEVLIKDGRAIQRYKDQLIELTCRAAKLESFLDHVVPVVNASCLFSEIGERLLQLFPEAPFAVSWFINDAHMIQYSLRSRPTFDVSKIAKLIGGGGHKQAAGSQAVWGEQHLEVLEGAL